MRRTTRAVLGLAPIVLCLLAAGCGSGDDLARVKGTVTLNGEPLANATVDFRPVAPEGSPSAGETDEEGRYELMYSFEKRGAAPGEYVVSIRTAGTYFDEQGNELEREELVPPKYNTQSELKRTVEPGGNTFDFEL